MHSATAFHSVSDKQVAAWKPSSSPSGRRVEDQNEHLRHFIRQLQRMQFGRRSEKLDPDQLALALEIFEQAIAESEAQQEKADQQVRYAGGRQRRQAAPRRINCRGSRW